MKVLEQPGALRGEQQAVVFTIGSFDGIHLGHQALIQQALEAAAREKGQAWVLTFDPHPLKVLMPHAAPALLTSTAHKLRLLEAFPLEGCILMRFDRQLAHLEPEGFLQALRRDVPTLREIVVGRNWRFGHRARGDVDLLKHLAPQLGVRSTVLEPVCDRAGPISSSRVRRSVAEGRLEQAAGMLGRPFSVFGRVVHGREVGRELGFPTANVDPANEVRPPEGIYAVQVIVDGVRHNGAGYLGRSGGPDKTPGRNSVVEVHLFDVAIDLYGRDIEVLFIERLREDRRFASKEQLREQIARDVERARALLAAHPHRGEAGTQRP